MTRFVDNKEWTVIEKTNYKIQQITRFYFYINPRNHSGLTIASSENVSMTQRSGHRFGGLKHVLDCEELGRPSSFCSAYSLIKSLTLHSMVRDIIVLNKIHHV